ncbi:2-amino-4,5-dihydroxy-6-one-heptanoic acid-7-phosphate synthase [Actinoplanes sp. ATCC 53533]|uniref:2-amino-3,7-dideoxy-D-threo-hept-6-ulosonate synthase n=1 Tax=Actinoplanes sp. ATCC 53533 TaxID=1288362 RepID=UPI000F794BAA|nr:2-amino-3,7-dideoxy-D-threo-hept-6-ulosonate synthase [Actinoplanes sp. ATCC 53533]RSM46484.1 2-amino-4,5-dihydroxy-6-one-heptanoic acid-7-phosphate synthase [Actinoplanes sp. ATCC 53533]
MQINDTFARKLRLRHLYRHDAAGLLVVPLDHAIGAGPLTAGRDLDSLVAEIADNGADAVVLHKGALRRVHPRRFRQMSLILQLNAGTSLASDPDAKYPVATVAEALRLGAHAVSVHVNAASLTEDRQVAHLASVAGACDRWGVPLLAMMYVRGPDVVDGTAPALVTHAVAIATELGADLVKTALPAAAAVTAGITASCPVPVLAAGGAVSGGADATLARLAAAVSAGAGGIAAGRLVFTADDPGAVVRRLAALVHGRVPVPAR